MNIKHLYISTGVLLVLAAITFFIKNADSSAPEDPRVGTAILQMETLQGTASIALTTEDETFHFVKGDGSDWHLTEAYGLPVDLNKLGRLITSLTEARLERLVSSKKERIADLGFVGDSITFFDGSDTTMAHVELGRETENGKQLVRFAEEDKAFLANDQFNLDDNRISWLKKDLVTFERDDIRGASIKLANGDTLEAFRESTDEGWMSASSLPEGKQLDQGALTRALNRFTNMKFTELEELDNEEVVAARAHAHHLEITLEGGNSYSFQIGQRPEVKVMKEVETEGENGETTTEMKEEVETPAGASYVSISSLNASDPINGYMEKTAFEVASYQFTSLPKTLEDLLSDIPEPEPEPEASEAEAAIESSEGE